MLTENRGKTCNITFVAPLLSAVLLPKPTIGQHGLV